MSVVPTSIDAVVRGQLCTGCGACAYIAPDQISMEDQPDKGRRPRMRAGDPLQPADTALAEEALTVCPGRRLAHDYRPTEPPVLRELAAGWGPVVSLWEGHAVDPELRFAGSSGGACSALALFALSQGYAGVVHTAASKQSPHLNETVVSRSREELLVRTGSRYAPASPCEGLQTIENGDGLHVFIGKPCDVAAAQAARRLRPELDARLGLTLTFFCAGTPSTEGTLEMLRVMGVDDPAALSSLRYRGEGWPGLAKAAVAADSELEPRALSYDASWGGILSKHVQWRCRLCVDHTGEFGDIAVGDAWYRELGPDEPGSSLIVARTARGQAFLQAALDAGYLQAAPVAPHLLLDSQPNLLRTRGAVWGRLLGARLVGAAVPRYRRLPTFRFWLTELSLAQKIASVFGTMRRCLRRGLHCFRG